MMPHWTQDDLIVNGAQLHYYRTGHGEKRPIVLVHGGSDNGLCWTPVACALESEYDVIMPDMRSHGLSDRYQPEETIDMAADVAELIRELGLERPIVAGHSMGGGVSYQLTVRFPHLVRALILEDAPFLLPRPEPATPSGQPTESPVVKWARSLPGKTMEQLLEEYHRDHPTWPEQLVIPMCESKKQLDPTFIERISKQIHADQASWPTTVQAITQPVLLFTANPALGAMVLPEGVAKVRELNPNIRIVHISDAGHLIRFDKFEAFMDALWAFLKQLPARPGSYGLLLDFRKMCYSLLVDLPSTRASQPPAYCVPILPPAPRHTALTVFPDQSAGRRIKRARRQFAVADGSAE